jgi:hypothetical protein
MFKEQSQTGNLCEKVKSTRAQENANDRQIWQWRKKNSIYYIYIYISLSPSPSLQLKINTNSWESPTRHNHHKTKCPKAAQAHGHQQSSANATATGLLSECHGVDGKTGAEEEHLKSMSLKGLPIELGRPRTLKLPVEMA